MTPVSHSFTRYPQEPYINTDINQLARCTFVHFGKCLLLRMILLS